MKVLVKRTDLYANLHVEVDGKVMTDKGATVDISVEPYASMIERGILSCDADSLAKALADAAAAAEAAAKAGA